MFFLHLFCIMFSLVSNSGFVGRIPNILFLLEKGNSWCAVCSCCPSRPIVQICSLFWPQLAKYDKRVVNGVSRATRVLLLLMILVLMLCVCVLFVQS